MKKELSKFFNKNIVILLMVLLSILVIGFSTFRDYGLSTDEPTEIGMVRMNVEYIQKEKPFTGDLKYYGTVFNFASEAVFQISKYVQKGFSYDPFSELKDVDLSGKRLLSRITIKHFLTFATSLIAYISVAQIVSILSGSKYAWFGVICLALMPRFYGHSFFNPKDIPFAAMFTASTLLGAYLIKYYLTVERKLFTVGKNRVTILSIIYGIFVGITTSTRIGGFVILGFVPLAYFIIDLNLKRLFQLCGYYLIMVTAWALTVTICHPASWKNPATWFLSAVTYMSKHGWDGQVLFNGNLIRGDEVPITYLPTWFLISTPTIFIAFFLVSLILIVRRYSSFSLLQKSCIILLILQIFFLPFIAIIKGSTIYDGLRQFLFVLPGIAALSSFAMVEVYKVLPWRKGKLFAFGFIGVIFAQILTTMIFLHPYQYIYFNRISRELVDISNLYETDYYALSAREAMEWINKNAPAGSKIVVGAPTVYSARSFGNDNFSYIHMPQKNPSLQKITGSYYYIAIPKSYYQSQLSNCETIYQVTRLGIALTTVKKCQ